ncbi:MAG: PSD1 and planctomycete cytochrome C domain-containing protein [Planctomycetes bacterium]|nr:PSD1 and planctomycete cytochrome C domain-containing protein [Planctomycetota bacterium]
MVRPRIFLLALFVSPWVIVSTGKAQAEPVKETPVDFTRDILPILANNCFQCHGQSETKGGVRLDQRDHAVKPVKSGKTPIVPGKSAQSELVRRILSTDDSKRMPPLATKKFLTAAEKELLTKWIDQGAEYKAHWSFIKPVRPTIPEVKDKAWIKNEIDAFILAKLEHAGLKPSPRADKTTLIRRLSFDLRGLPPSLQEVDEFLADKSPDAYEKLVDRMLASPRYGEKMAVLWLDLARFGDTSGFENDSSRQMWMWRDWVIGAFNKNMPFDQFTIEQLAGDLLPNATIEQKIASGFNRNTRFNEEAGSDPEEFSIRYNVDRTNTLGQIWLGATLGCAECHNHKYDPFSQKEYYQLYAYFTGIKEPFLSGNHNVPLPPILKKPSPEQAKSMEGMEKDRIRVQAAIDANLAKVQYKDPFEGKPESAKVESKPQDVVWFDDELPPGAKPEGTSPWPWHDALAHSGKRAMIRTGTGLHANQFREATTPLFVSPGDKLFVYVYLDPKNPPQSIMLEFDDGSREHRAYWGADKCYLAGTPNGPQHFNAGALPAAGKWARLEVETDRLNLQPDTRIRGMAFVQFDGTAYFDTPGLQTNFAPDDRCRSSLTLWEPRAKANTKLPADVKAAIKVDAAKRSAEQKTKILHHYIRHVYDPTRSTFEPLEKELSQVAKKIKEIDDGIPYTMVSEEMSEPRAAYIYIRGDFQKKGDKVERATPSVFPPMSKGLPNNRLGLAQWLMQADHPLTSRVTVNRLWAQMMSTGLVKTIGDFGTQGEFPSHPELLDWLATEFMAPTNGVKWDVKRFLKMIALSNTYQQSSAISPSTASKVDPNNRLFSRAPRFRLAAEEVRDSALAISGLLSAKIGGPSVMPYQPSDFYKGKYETWLWTVSVGDDQYRRGMYTFWRRTTLHPMFAIFDAPSREECSVARARTNTPLQALVTLNDPTFVEAARVFAQKVLKESSGDIESRLRFAFRSALAREPNSAELDALRTRYEKHLERYRADKAAAAKLVQVGQFTRPTNLDAAEHAAWTSVCNILLNLDETITRE